MPEVPNTSETWAIVKEELEVLEAIWGEDMEDRGRLRGLPKTAFQVNAKAALIQRKDDDKKIPSSSSVPSVTLLVSFMRGYPRVPPKLSIETSTGLTKHGVNELLSSLVEEANQHSKRRLNGGEADIGFIYDLLVMLQAYISEEAERQERANHISKSLYEKAAESADHEKVEQMRLREAEVEKKRAMEEERLRKEEKKKTDMQVEAEAGRRLQQEASKTLIDSNSNQSRRIWQQQEDFESDVGSHASMDSGEKGEWGGRSGTGSSWLTRQFKEIGVIGRGGFGTVVKVRNRVDKRLYAIKRIPLDATDSETNRRIRREATTISRMHHTNIVRYYHAVVEYEEGEDVSDQPLQNELDGQEEGDTSDPEREIYDLQMSHQFSSVSSAGLDFEAEEEDDGEVISLDRETGNKEGMCLHKRCPDDHYVSTIADQRTLEISGMNVGELEASLKEEDDGTEADELSVSCGGDEAGGGRDRDCSSSDTRCSWSDNPVEPAPSAKVLSPREFASYCKNETFLDNHNLQAAIGTSWSSQDGCQEYFGRTSSSKEFVIEQLDDKRERKEEEVENYCDAEEPHDLHIHNGVESVTKLPGQRVLMIQMEYCHQTLRSILDTSGLMERDVWRIFCELLDSVEFIHSKGVIHRDIKPENVFFDQEGVVKLGDFGLATSAVGPTPGDFIGEAVEGTACEITDKKIGACHMHTPSLSLPLGGSSQMSAGVGTLFYRAPEQERSRGKYSYPADMFSLGVVLFEMNMEPFRTKMERSKVMSELRDRGKCPSAFENRVTLSAQKVIEWLMQHDPSARPSAKELQSSPLLPPKMEVKRAYLQETLNSIRHLHSVSFSRIVEAIHSRHNPEYVEYTFDQDRLKHITEIQGQIVSSCATALHSTMRTVFETHGAIPLSPPMLMPTRKSSNGVQLLDKGGQLLMLPSDLTSPFARYMARKGVYNIKRYHFGTVYRPAEPDQHPHEMEEVDFDAVTVLSPTSPSSGMVVVEAILVTAQILSAFKEELGSWTLRIGDGRLTAAILELNEGTAREVDNRVASRLSRAWSLQALTGGKCTPRALNAALGTRIASDEKLMYCLRPLINMGTAVAVEGMTSPDKALLELRKAIKGLPIVRSLDRSGDIEKNTKDDKSLATRTTTQLPDDDKCEDDFSSTGVRERQRKALAHVRNSLQAIKDVLRCLRLIGLYDDRAGGTHLRKRRNQKKRGGVVSSNEGLGENIYSEVLQLTSSETLSPGHIVFDPGLSGQNGPYGESIVFQATLADGVVVDSSSSNVSGGGSGGSSGRNDVLVLDDVNARSVAEGGRYEKMIERQHLGIPSKDFQLVAVGVRFAAERVCACIARNRLRERDRLGPRAPPPSLDPTRCPLDVLVCSEVDGLGTTSMEDRALVAFHLQVAGLRVEYMVRGYLLSKLGGGSSLDRSQGTVGDLRLFSFDQLLELCTRVKIPVVVAISEHHLHTRGLVKIAFTFDGSSTPSFNSSADSNLIFLRDASNHIVEHLNKLLFRVPLPTLSLKCPSNNDAGPGRLSSAEPLASVFSEDLVKVLGEQMSSSSKRHAFKQKSHMMKRIRAILEGINHSGSSRRTPAVLVSELPFAAVRELCTSFVLSGGGTPTLPSHLAYSTKHVKLLLEALTDSEREAKIDSKASRIIYIYSLPDSLIDIVTFSATS